MQRDTDIKEFDRSSTAKDTSVYAALDSAGPSLSSTIASILEAQGLSNEAARKRIQRARSPVRKLAGIRFPKGERFLYLEDQFGSEDFQERLLGALNQTNSVYGIAIGALKARGGAVPVAHFHGACGSPLRIKRHISSERILSNLMEIGLLRTIHDDHIGDVVALYDGPESLRGLRARLVAEGVLLESIRDFLRKLGLVSYGAVRQRTETGQPEFGQLNWDLTGPSYVYPFVTFQGNSTSPGFFVSDVLLNGELSLKDIQWFINKSRILSVQRQLRPFMAMLLVERFSSEAFKACKTAGILPVTPSNLLGEEVARALLDLVNTLDNAAKAVVNNPEKIGEFFSKLATTEGSAGNLRGALFPLLVGYCVKKMTPGFLEIGQSVPNTDIDVLLINKNKFALAIECRGKLASGIIGEDEISRWIDHKIQHSKEWLRNREDLRHARLRFEFWTTGTFSKEALELLERYKASVKKYDVEWKNGEAVRDFVRAAEIPFLYEVLNEHFLKHPLASL